MSRNIKIIIAMIMIFSLMLGQAALAYQSASSFNDINGNWAEKEITDLINLGIIDGYEDSTVRPNSLITRAEFAQMLLKALEIKKELDTNEVYFMDVKPTDWYYKSITVLKQLSIIDGYEDKTFKPAKNITRAEMLAMIVRISKSKLNLTQSTKIYKDINVSHWAYWNIGLASRAGLVAQTGEFIRPNENVTRAEVAYSIDKMLWNMKTDQGVPAEELIALAKNYNDKMNIKYNNVQADMTDMIDISYGGQLAELEQLSKKLSMYNTMNVKYDRTMSLSDSKLSAFSYNLARVTFNYNLSSKMFIGKNVNTVNQRGLLTYLLKKVDDDWLVYDEMALNNEDSGQQLGKLNIVWDYMNSPMDNFRGGKIEGLDVISPTWFEISDITGNVSSIASSKYLDNAHNNGYNVWPLITNKFDPKLTSELLRNPNARKKLVNNLVMLVDKYDIDGLNIDFENMYKSDRDTFTQFVREISLPLKSRGVILSVDVTVKVPGSTWSDCYDRAELSKIADYIAVMTYDQHWSTSPVSGSVAQISWVENSINNLFNEIPKSKMLLGLPFYTREWKEINTPTGVAVTSEALTMGEAKKRITNNGAKMVWDDKSGQYFAQYTKDGAIYKIWLEDAKSIDIKSKLVGKYDLAGVASWKAGLETSDIWGILKQNLNK